MSFSRTQLSNDRRNLDPDLYDSSITLLFKSGLNMNGGKKREGIHEMGK